MKRLVYGGLLMVVGMATAGCGGQTGHRVGLPVDSDTIVLEQPEMEVPAVVGGDSIDNVPPPPSDTMIRNRKEALPTADSQRLPQEHDSQNGEQPQPQPAANEDGQTMPAVPNETPEPESPGESLEE